jgi:uncharacterized protein YpmS
MDQRKLVSLSIPVFIVLTMLSCTIFVGGPGYPSRNIPISTESVATLQASINHALEIGAETGYVTITITESQLTSYLAFKLQQQVDPFLTNPQVYLQEGQVQIYGTAIQGYFQATAVIVLVAHVNDTGQIEIELTSVDFGPLPVPKGLISSVSALLEEAFTGTIGPVATGIRLTEISIGNGIITVIGQIK